MANSKSNAKRKSTKAKSAPQTKRGAVSAKQKKMVKDLKRSSTWNDALPWIFGVCAVLFWIFLFFPKNTGWFGPLVGSVLCGLFGVVGAFVLPALLLNVALFWRRDEENGIRGIKMFCSALFLLFLSVFFHAFVKDSALTTTFDIGTLYESGKTFPAGGVFGSLAGNALISVVARPVTGIFSVIILLFCFCFLLGKTPGELISSIREKWRENRERVRAYQEEGEGEEGELYVEGKEEKPAKKGRAKAILLEEEEEEEPAVSSDNAPDEKDLEIPLNDRGTDPDCEDITELNPRRAATLSGAVQNVFGQKQDKKALEKFSDEELDDAAEEFGAEVDLVAEKAEEKAEAKPSAPRRSASYRFPPLSLLSDERVRRADSMRECREVGDKLVKTLETFHVSTSLIGISQGPTVTRYELQPEVGVRVKTIAGLSEDIALRLAARDVRIEAPIPGREAVGIEVPNKSVSKVGIRELLEDAAFKKDVSPLVVCLGMDVAGEHVFCNIAKMPHLLIAGATGSGKSVCINSFLTSILYKARPDEVKLILIDPKSVELTGYNGIAHLLVPVVCDSKKAAGALNWAVNEMERRYAAISEKNVRNIAAYNKAAKEDGEETMPHIVIVIDELADLMLAARDSVETAICRLAQKARAAGIHLVLGTQRPSVDVITGLIKSNIPSRIAFTVASQIDSRTILDSAGAEKLLGNGDMLYAPIGSTKPIRVQGAFVSEEEVSSVVQFLKQSCDAAYSEETMADIEKEAEKCDKKKGSAAAASEGGSSLADQDGDDLFFRAVELALDNGGIATSLLQRRLSVGYARAARLIDMMEERGIVGPHNGSKPRELRITAEEYMEMKAKSGDIE